MAPQEEVGGEEEERGNLKAAISGFRKALSLLMSMEDDFLRSKNSPSSTSSQANPLFPPSCWGPSFGLLPNLTTDSVPDPIHTSGIFAHFFVYNLPTVADDDETSCHHVHAARCYIKTCAAACCYNIALCLHQDWLGPQHRQNNSRLLDLALYWYEKAFFVLQQCTTGLLRHGQQSSSSTSSNANDLQRNNCTIWPKQI